MRPHQPHLWKSRPSNLAGSVPASQKTQQAPLLHLRLLVLSGILLPSG